MAKKLSVKQENFCNYYIECGNASEAYRRAYSCNKMKPETVNNKASELLKKGEITARVEELQAEQKNKSDITKERILAELANIVFSSFADIHATMVERKEFDKLPASAKAAIKNISVRTIKRGDTEDGAEIEYVKVELYDKIKAIERICKMLGFDTPSELKIKQESPMSHEDVLKELARLEQMD